MRRILPIAIFALTFGLHGVSFAQHHEDGEQVRVISSQEIKEKLDGKDAKATIVEVTIEPGKSGLPHKHPGSALVYVLEGEYELGIDDEPTKRFKAGETFYEPAGCLHRVSRNPATKGRTRLIAVVLHPANDENIAVPVELHK
jgi:quercetin dioxygenase-like cupin family protein